MPASPEATDAPTVRKLGLRRYEQTYAAMRRFTEQRTAQTVDEIWLLQHHPVFTQGQAGKAEHILNATDDIPIVQSDRGGQVTYHGPGQLIVYLLIDLRRRGMHIRQLVDVMEQSVTDLLKRHGIVSHGLDGQPGVYVDDRKIASLGLRVRRGCSYHGLSLNVDMDLSAFHRINPCGIEALQVTQMRDLGYRGEIDDAAEILAQIIVENLQAV